ncbi:unnamed protein product [Tenebrio molitor]|nr:unnamed protein product [Tenebrio molitor]
MYSRTQWSGRPRQKCESFADSSASQISDSSVVSRAIAYSRCRFVRLRCCM